MILIDSNILIYSESDSAPEHAAAISKIGEAASRGRLGINVIVASEVFHKLRGFFGAVEASARVSRMISDPNSEYVEFTPEQVVRATKLSRDFSIRINDALIAQQALDLGVPILTDNVRDFAKIKAVKVIALRQLV